jgi:predicted RNA-binding protein with PUA-like domain
MAYWMMKTEPNEFSFEDLLRDGRTKWDGVRNFQARNNMKAMKQGDQVLIYHSVGPKDVVGIAEVSREHYPDPVDNEKGQWVLVDIVPVRALKKPVNLTQIKTDPALANLPLIKQSRLSVLPLTKAEFDHIVKLGG